MVQLWGEGMVGTVRTEQLQDLCDSGNAVWCKHSFTTLLYMQEWLSSGMRNCELLSHIRARKAKCFLQSKCHCYDEHS